MKASTILALGAAAAVLSSATAAFAGLTVINVGAPAPLLGAGLPGLAVMAAAGAGYLAVRMRRRGRD